MCLIMALIGPYWQELSALEIEKKMLYLTNYIPTSTNVIFSASNFVKIYTSI